jgi:hypothetical protein
MAVPMSVGVTRLVPVVVIAAAAAIAPAGRGSIIDDNFYHIGRGHTSSLKS